MENQIRIGIIGCGINGDSSGGNTTDAQIMAIYNSYLANLLNTRR